MDTMAMPIIYAAGGLCVGLCADRLMSSRPPIKRVHVERDILVPEMDVKRQAAIANGAAMDHYGCVVEAEDPSFNLDATIFHSVEGVVQRAFLKKQLSRVAYWSDDSVLCIHRAYRSIPAPPPVDKSLTDFMMNECNFKMEHADGSFMDHVSFCHDYCAAYYKGHSPRVLLLHSIMGVGTNFFPMEVGKITKLEQLVSKEEMQHIEVFPSILRLILGTNFLNELRSLESPCSLKTVSMRRVIDNKPVELDADTFWTHLNYQLIHFMDFLPVADWPQRTSEPIFIHFLELRDFLRTAGKLQATVNLGSAAGDVPSQEALLQRAHQSPVANVKKELMARGIKKYSAAIHHDLVYSLTSRTAA